MKEIPATVKIEVEKIPEGFLLRIYINGKFFDTRLLSEKEIKFYFGEKTWQQQ